jgi:transcriptional regulator with XRE-family HTH domain
MNFPELVKATREKQDLTFDGFGKAIGVTRQTVNHWELGKRTPDISFLLITATKYNDWRRVWANQALEILRPGLFAPSSINVTL